MDLEAEGAATCRHSEEAGGTQEAVAVRLKDTLVGEALSSNLLEEGKRGKLPMIKTVTSPSLQLVGRNDNFENTKTS